MTLRPFVERDPQRLPAFRRRRRGLRLAQEISGVSKAVVPAHAPIFPTCRQPTDSWETTASHRMSAAPRAPRRGRRAAVGGVVSRTPSGLRYVYCSPHLEGSLPANSLSPPPRSPPQRTWISSYSSSGNDDAGASSQGAWHRAARGEQGGGKHSRRWMDVAAPEPVIGSSKRYGSGWRKSLDGSRRWAV
jgi:hypothetical protein